MNNKVLNFINISIDNIKKQLSKADLSDTAKEGLLLRLEAFEDIKERLDWVLLPDDNKQSSRILELAKSREAKVDVTNQLKEINLYSKVKEVIPYIQAVSYIIINEEKHLTQDLLEFCKSQLEIIDNSPQKRKYFFPSKEEIELAFKSYIERIKPNKIPSLKVYNQPEVVEKIEELYNTFIKLHE